MNFRDLSEFLSQMVTRSHLANVAGRTFGGKRDMYKALGYKREIFLSDYRSRFDRNEIANRIVKAPAQATWRGGAELIEDEDPTTETEFEWAFDQLNKRVKVWSVLKQADILAGIGRFAIVLIGAPGKLMEPLDTLAMDDLKYLQPYAEDDAKVFKFDIDPQSPRFGKVEFYNLTRNQTLTPSSSNSNVVGQQVHHSRVIHVADGLLDDNVYGEPRLRAIWNRLDDLEKIAGGGAEAFWKRADQGTQFDLDPTLEFEDDDTANVDKSSTPAKSKQSGMGKQIEEYEHGLRRFLLTRGVKVNSLGSDVADFKSQVDAIIGLISAGTGIPQRVLMGSEQGRLAAKADRTAWEDRITDRRDEYAGPCVVRQLVDRLIELGTLPKTEEYSVRWPDLKVMDDIQRAEIAKEWSLLNNNMQDIVVLPDEIRDRVLDLPPLQEVQQILSPVNAQRYLRKWAVLSRKTRDYYAPVRMKKKNKTDEEVLLTALAAAIEHGQTAVIEQLTGLKLMPDPTPVVAALAELNTQAPDLAPVWEMMRAELTANRLPPVINITVEPAPVPNVTVTAPQVHVVNQPRPTRGAMLVTRGANNLIERLEEE